MSVIVADMIFPSVAMLYVCEDRDKIAWELEELDNLNCAKL